MPKLDSPLLLSPVFKPKIWGRNDLSPLYSRPRNRNTQTLPSLGDAGSGRGPEELIGEVWLTDDASRFLSGPLAGSTLAEASEEYGPELLGASWISRRFPILAKYIYTSDWLSVQVHPDDDYARAHDPGSPGKCEMWYIVESERGGEILLGLKPGVSMETLKEGFEEGTSRALLRRFHPTRGEAIFVPPGTVHALGPGLVLFEVEENSDLTYRLDDFGRLGLDGKPRPLHWDKGLNVIRVELPAYRALPRIRFREPYGERRYVLACRYFAVEELTLRKTATFEGRRERVEGFSVLQGNGRVETTAGWLAYRTGNTWLVPPATDFYRLAPVQKTRLLKFYVPEFDREFRQPLARRGANAAQMRKILFA